jgi:type IV secretory pathway TraG/TraD family ATPase VirD4
LSRFKNGVIIGRKRALSKAESYRNILIAGATGAGKTSVIKNNLYRWGEQIKGRKQISIPIISSIYNFIRPHGFDSYVLVDLDGSGYRETAGWLKKCGADIYRLDFSGNNPLQTMHFNFIENAKGDKDQTKEICDFLCHTGGKSDFWDISSSELDTLFSIAISQCQDKNLRHVGNTRFLINTLLTAPKELDQWILDHVTDEGLRAEYLAIKGLDERLKGNIVKSATASLDAYKIEAIQKIMCGTGQQFAPSLLRRPGKPTILYITMPESKLINRHYRNQIGIIFNQMMDSFFTDGMGGNPAYGGCCFILDEAGILAASGALPHLDSQLTQGRKHKISNILITQDLGFFTSYFGEGRSKALLAGGIVTRVFLS